MGGQGGARGQMGSLLGPTPNKVDPMALVGNLVGAMMGAGGQGQGNPLQHLAGIAMASAAMQGPGGSVERGGRGYDRDRRVDRQRGRPADRSPPRRSFRSRSRDRRPGNGYAGGSRQRRSSGAGGGSRRDKSQEKRAEHEIYVGNYPVKFREADVRKLFEDNEIKVGAIRLKHDGLKVFAFAETESVEMVEKAKAEMEGVEIQGRKLRVRSSKDTDKKRREERGSGSGRDDWRSERKKRVEKEPLKREDVTRHLVAGFVSFIERELGREGEDQTEEFKGLMEAAKTALNTAYSLPEDESLKVPRNIEDIFFRDVRNDIRIDRVDVKSEIKEEKEDGEGEEDDDGNWKRRGRGKDDKEENDNGEEDEDNEDEKDSKEDEENMDVTEMLEEANDEDDEEEIDDGNNDLENAIAKEEEENDGGDIN
eukprot:GFUD01022000.1.p1 GENE.GFUD01022000.1~~GFUD01022000.1.p1  ORF type:complete len:423 (+),score=175.76 GFUD01022000.1:190-1458(+)